jgi:hypothetical protein
VVRFRTIRQRRRRARKGQVAAVATVLGLLLVVTYLSNYLEQQLPAALTSSEFTHVLQVENQLAQLQATILVESESIAPGLALASPVTLGTGGVPPFGPPTSGAILPESTTIDTTASYALGTIVSHYPNWGAGSACLSGGTGTCAVNNQTDSWNETGHNGTTFSVTISHTGNSLFYNLTGSNDTLTITWSGGNTHTIDVVVNGSYDTVNYVKSGTDTNSPRASFWFYGRNDKFNLNPAGSTSSAQGSKVLVEFVGGYGGICPYGNWTNLDSVGTLTSGGTNLNLTVTWWNMLGYTTATHPQTYPGGGGHNETVYWSNATGVQSCAFTANSATMYHSDYAEGIAVQMYNRYLPPTYVVYDQGAVIEEQLGGTPVMFSPPALTVTPTAAGYAAAITLVDVDANFTTETGVQTAAVSTQILNHQTIVVKNGLTSDRITSPFFLNITTAYPKAWLSYVAAQPELFPFGASCVDVSKILSPYSCGNPPTGGIVQIRAEMSVVQLTVTALTVKVSIS